MKWLQGTSARIRVAWGDLPFDDYNGVTRCSSEMAQLPSFQVSVSEINVLCSEFPMTVQNGSNWCKINQVLSLEEGESAWQTFNQRLDALFGENCRDAAGQLCHICHGEFIPKPNHFQGNITIQTNIL